MRYQHIKKSILAVLLFFISMNIGYSQILTADYVNIKSGNFKGLRFWSNNNYKIHMGNTSYFHYGPVTSYSIKNNMSNNANRGWTWGISGQSPIAALNTQGKFQTNSWIKSMARRYYFGDVQNLYGDNNHRLIFQSNHSSDTRILMRDKEGTNYGSLVGNGNGNNFGLLDGDHQWSYLAVKDNYTAFRINNSEKMRIKSNGYVGIGTPSPTKTLDVNGSIKADDMTVESLEANTVESETYTYGANANHEIYAENAWYTTIKNSSHGNSGIHLVNNQNERYGSLMGVYNKFGLLDKNGKWIFYQNGDHSMSFLLNNNIPMHIISNGNVGIGTVSPTEKLAVDGTIRTKKIIVDTGWADYVFNDNYSLTTLESEEEYIENHGHLSGFLSEKEMDGTADLGDVSKRQQVKIEEIMLHLIELNKTVKTLEQENKKLKDALKSIK